MSEHPATSPAVTKCKHGMIPDYCGFCRAPSTARTPRHRKAETSSTVAARGAVARSGIYDPVIVRTYEGRKSQSFSDLGRYVRAVHIQGHPFLWAIERILDECPNLKQIQMPAKMLAKLKPGSQHRKLCAERSVSLVAGWIRPEQRWDGIRSPWWAKQRHFLKTLPEPQRALWDELLAMDFKAARLAERYFCLRDGDEPTAMRVLGREWGMAHESHVSACVNSVLVYLDPEFEAGEVSVRRAEAMKHRVERYRAILADAERMRLWCESLGIARLPEGLAAARYDLFERVMLNRSRLSSLPPDNRVVIERRFGINRPRAETLEEIGNDLGITREGVRVREVKALQYMGLNDEEED